MASTGHRVQVLYLSESVHMHRTCLTLTWFNDQPPHCHQVTASFWIIYEVKFTIITPVIMFHLCSVLWKKRHYNKVTNYLVKVGMRAASIHSPASAAKWIESYTIQGAQHSFACYFHRIIMYTWEKRLVLDTTFNPSHRHRETKVRIKENTLK